MMSLQVELGERSYPIMIGAGAIELLAEQVKRLRATSVLICTNTTVGPLYLDRIVHALEPALPRSRVGVVTLEDGEQYKNLAHIEQILQGAVQTGLDRHSLMIALGGGVVGDMTGFAASLWMRGIDFIQIPTTLLAQVDSSVGGKTGVNLAAGKNLIGSFHQPAAVLIDPAVLTTLPARQISAGLAEVIKYGLLGDEEFVCYLEKNMSLLRTLDTHTVSRVIAHCCRMKADIVRQDEKELGIRAKLNLGHTFGHAIEKLTGFHTWLHGEAVGTGLVMAARLSCQMGQLSEQDALRVQALVHACGLPVQIAGLDADAAFEAMQTDKKSVAGQIYFVLMQAIGKTQIQAVSEAFVRRTMLLSDWT